MKWWKLKVRGKDRLFLDEETAMQTFEAHDGMCAISSYDSVTGIEKSLQHKSDWETPGVFKTEIHYDEEN